MEPATILLLVALLLIPAYKLLKTYNKNRRIAKYIDRLPGPKKYPIFGTSFELMRIPRDRNEKPNFAIAFFYYGVRFFFVEFWQALRKRAKTYGPLYRSWYGSLPTVHLLKPEHMEVGVSTCENVGLIYCYYIVFLGGNEQSY